jgi:hypothetical protein
MESIARRLEQLPDFLQPLRDACEHYIKRPSELREDGAINIGNRPWVAPQNYIIVLYPGLTDDDIDRYSNTFEISIPDCYVNFLRSINGAFCFGMSLFGIPRSMLGTPPTLDRSVLQCHDLAIAATEWVQQYRVPAGLFHFGFRHLSYHENVGYFFYPDERIISARADGQVLGSWPDLCSFLQEELVASERLEEKLHPAQWAGERE